MKNIKLQDPAAHDIEEAEKKTSCGWENENIPVKEILVSFRFLFEELSFCGEKEFSFRCQDPFEEKFLASLRYFLLKIEEEQEKKRIIYLDQTSEERDSIDACNHLFLLFSKERSFRSTLDDCLFFVLFQLMSKDGLCPQKIRDFSREDSFSGICMDHAVFFAVSLAKLFSSYATFLQHSGSKVPSRLLPFPRNVLENSFFCRSTKQAIALELLSGRAGSRIFSGHTIFRRRKGKFIETVLPSIRKLEDFYGYAEAKKVIGEHLDSFEANRHNLPLLLSGLPGLGKTQMTIAHILSHKDFILILPSPEELEEGLEDLIGALAVHKEKKFVIFFDDVDVRETNWYSFRTFVGGSSTLPENELIIIASNYQYPPNVASRGRTFSFPLFDEIRCQEMIGDLFLSRGMQKVSPDLLSVIASDYVEAFGQKEFDELSPRTLARYLQDFLKDQPKRRRLLEFSRGQLITRPDPGLFHEQNVKLFKALYGEEEVEKLRKSVLGS